MDSRRPAQLTDAGEEVWRQHAIDGLAAPLPMDSYAIRDEDPYAIIKDLNESNGFFASMLADAYKATGRATATAHTLRAQLDFARRRVVQLEEIVAVERRRGGQLKDRVRRLQHRLDGLRGVVTVLEEERAFLRWVLLVSNRLNGLGDLFDEGSTDDELLDAFLSAFRPGWERPHREIVGLPS